MKQKGFLPVALWLLLGLLSLQTAMAGALPSNRISDVRNTKHNR